MTVDILMTAVLLGLMTYSFIGEKAHEWLGMVMLLLFVFHHILNRSWLKSLGRGSYSPYRVFQTFVVILMLFCMLGSMVSGILISRYLFPGWADPGLYETASQVHLFCAYWGFILMSAHIGLHWRMIMGIMKSRIKRPLPKITGQCLRILAAGIALYGAYVFIHNQVPSYLFLQTHFVMYDFDATLLRVLRDELAMMGLFLYLAYYTGGMLQKNKKGVN